MVTTDFSSDIQTQELEGGVVVIDRAQWRRQENWSCKFANHSQCATHQWSTEHANTHLFHLKRKNCILTIHCTAPPNLVNGFHSQTHALTCFISFHWFFRAHQTPVSTSHHVLHPWELVAKSESHPCAHGQRVVPRSHRPVPHLERSSFGADGDRLVRMVDKPVWQ